MMPIRKYESGFLDYETPTIIRADCFKQGKRINSKCIKIGENLTSTYWRMGKSIILMPIVRTRKNSPTANKTRIVIANSQKTTSSAKEWIKKAIFRESSVVLSNDTGTLIFTTMDFKVLEYFSFDDLA